MFDYQKKGVYFAQIADGLEESGAAELTALGATGTRPVRRGIHFQADPAGLYRINYCSRLCTRILAPLKTFDCPDADALYRAGRSIPWDRFFECDDTFAVFASTAGSSVPHSQFAALKLKDAVADRFRRDYGRRPSVDVRQPDLWINLHLQKEKGTISIDASGGSLHRRGYHQCFILYGDPNVAKAGAIQSQGAKGAAVVIYCNPLATPDLDGSGFPARGTT
jgi:putative N6-adenine-specific DNA methylase